MDKKHPAQMEFHVSRAARDRYRFDHSLFSFNGNVIFANFYAARLFAQKMNEKRDLVTFPEQAVRSGQINAMGLIDEILHIVVEEYRRQVNPKAFSQAIDWLSAQIGDQALQETLYRFCELYPPTAVYRKEISLQDYLEGESDGRSHWEVALEEMLMLWLANMNPAFNPFQELFDDTEIKKKTAYLQTISNLHDFFDTQPPFGPDNENLIDLLRAPALRVPHSLSGQLEFLRTRWATLIGKHLYRLLSSLDLIKEEEKAIFAGPGPAQVYEFGGMELEPERFSPDKEWMPSVVLMAKNIYVWLDQISKKYKQSINRLDQIPDAELDNLGRWGFTGLWLIGLWERSTASKTIKQMRGNPEAVASAYSLFGYDIANDLGGDQAYQALRDRLWKRGVRLASDMVPNHMGIDSRWVIEHPDWFLSLDYSPFPNYTYNGPNLSWDQRVGIFLEDHYYDSSDAAVVFKRQDFWTGDTRYIYHGNDGTSMPWNDTAQLDYLKAEVREAVIQTILHVARKFSIIRFDAAMTLAKKHYQRLWYPEPGSGGDIPTRAEHGMTREEFDRAMPVEFWREVVDRVAEEVPDTLLLAEAFWLMEGYFVRTLGMHRVYNSAFMNMLRDEKNQEYRLVIKNTIEFDPEILKRYVNFMNNPDERTAVDQFGKGDKYFGICTLMATLPGLPMFGHGQIEGFTEKYGMEYRRAYWDETPDTYLVERHEREIFPLLRKRYLFAEAHDFRLYDFYSGEGHVNEDVYAYSNRASDERSLVVYHNKYAQARGWVRISAAFPIKTSNGDERILVQNTLGEGLGLQNDSEAYTIFRDHITGLEYIRNSREMHEQGLYIELEAYKCHVFMDFREVRDNQWRQYAQLSAYLNGAGVPSVEDALKEIFLQSVHQPFRELVNSGQYSWLIEHRLRPEGKVPDTLESTLDEVQGKAVVLLEEVKTFINGDGEPQQAAEKIEAELKALLELPGIETLYPNKKSRKYNAALKYLRVDSPYEGALASGDAYVFATAFSWLISHRLGDMLVHDDPSSAVQISRSWMDEWILGKIISQTIQRMGLDEDRSDRAAEIVKILITNQDWYEPKGSKKDAAYTALQSWLKNDDARRFLGINRYQGVLWFNKEAMEIFLWWMMLTASVQVLAECEQAEKTWTAKKLSTEIYARHDAIRLIQKAIPDSGYQVEKLLGLVKAKKG